MQDDGSVYRNTWQCVRSMAREEGFKSFFKGSWLRVIRVAPGTRLFIEHGVSFLMFSIA